MPGDIKSANLEVKGLFGELDHLVGLEAAPQRLASGGGTVLTSRGEAEIVEQVSLTRRIRSRAECLCEGLS